MDVTSCRWEEPNLTNCSAKSLTTNEMDHLSKIKICGVGGDTDTCKSLDYSIVRIKIKSRKQAGDISGRADTGI